MARGDFRQRVVFELVDEASAPARRIGASLEGIKGTLVALGAGAIVSKAFGALKEVLTAGAEGAAEAETATVRLRAALEAAGGGASAFADSLGRQAEAIQRLGIVNAEAVNSVQSLLANVGVAGSQLEQATQASVDLSAALGLSLDTAAVQVGKTLSGVAGDLGRLVPELAALSTESLKAGEGIRVLADRFAGQSAQQAETYANSINRLKEALAETAEVIGGSGANAGVSASIRALAAAIEDANQVAEGSPLTSFFGDLKQGALDLTTTLVVQGTTILETVGLFGQQTDATREAVAASREAEAAFQQEARAIEARAAAQRAAAEAESAFVEATKELGVVLESEVNAKLEENADLLEQADELYRRGVITRRDFEEVQRAIAEAEVLLNAELSGSVEALTAVENGYLTAGQAADEFNRRTSAVADSANRATASVVQLGNALGVVARSQGSQALVDAAVAAGNTPILGGTRIRLPGGGSRLVGR